MIATKKEKNSSLQQPTNMHFPFPATLGIISIKNLKHPIPIQIACTTICCIKFW